MVNANSIIQARDDFVEIESPELIVIHRNESLEISVTLHNTLSFTQTYTLELLEIDSSLIANGLPIQYTLDSNKLRQVKFTITSSNDAPYVSTIIKLNLTTDFDSNLFELIYINVLVAPQSNLNFGVSGVSELVVDPEVRTNLAVNLTNNGLISDNVTFSLSTQSSWNWGWNMNQTSGQNSIESLSPGQLCYVYFWIDIPPVINGAPLFNNGPRFTLTATSSLDYQKDQWSFDLLMSEFRNITIDTVSQNLTLDPSQNERMSITVRNVGNVGNKIDTILELIDESGQPIVNVQRADRIESDGWTVALFGAENDFVIQPNQTITFEVGFQAPADYYGSFDIRVIISPIGAVSKTKTVDLSADIEWQRSANIELLNEGCISLLPGNQCQSEIKIENTGNADDFFELKVSNIPSFLNTNDEQLSYSIPKNQAKIFGPIILTANVDVLAFENDNVTFKLFLGGTQTQIGEIRIPVIIAPVINWTVESSSEEIDGNGRLAISMTLRNDGNAIDGLMVQLQCSHLTKMSFIPPSGAIIEDGIEYPRSFEVNDLPLGSNFTIRAWAEIPSEQTSNGTMYLNTTIRSRFSPDLPFVYTYTADYIGTPWQNDNEEETGFNFAQLSSDVLQITKSWSLVIIAIILSGLIINRSLNDRKLRQEEKTIKRLLNQNQVPEKVGDWMGKFTPKQNKESQVIESPKISPERFENIFKANAGQSKQVSSPIEPKLRDAATMVLDIHDKNQIIESADLLLQQIKSDGIAKPPIENKELISKPLERNLTTRNDPNDLIPKRFESNKPIQNTVPLPKSKIDDDDLDL